MTIGVSSRLTTELLRMAWRGLAALATSDGFPEYIVDAQPQSSTSFKVDCICVADDGNMLFETTARDPFADWCVENAATSCVDALSASRSIDDSLILFVKLCRLYFLRRLLWIGRQFGSIVSMITREGREK